MEVLMTFISCYMHLQIISMNHKQITCLFSDIILRMSAHENEEIMVCIKKNMDNCGKWASALSMQCNVSPKPYDLFF